MQQKVEQYFCSMAATLFFASNTIAAFTSNSATLHGGAVYAESVNIVSKG